MSLPDRHRPLSAVPEGAPGGDPARDVSGQRNPSRWPTSGLTATTMTLLLAVAITAPTALGGSSSPLLPVLALPAVLATLAGRLLFESIDRGGRLSLISALAGSTAAELIMGAAALILGVPVDLAVVVVSIALGAVALTGAGLVRDLEIRVRLSLRRVFLVGTAESLRGLRRELIRSPEASLVGAVGARSALDANGLSAAVQTAGATLLVLDGAAAASPAVISAATALTQRGVRVRDLLSYYEAEFKQVPLTELTPAWFLFLRERHEQTTVADALRRVTTSCAAAVMLLVSAPLLAALAIAIRLTSPGPAIFRQPRVGKDGAQFTVFKLRTMTEAGPPTWATEGDGVWATEGDGVWATEGDGVWATDLDHRITPLGRTLRRYRLDELPQLWNVLRGELALIGPRPEQVPIVQRLEREIPFYGARHTVRPGLTGWAQVNLGYAGSLDGARAKLQRDLYYVKHRSLKLDLLILWLTVKAVLTDPS